MCLALRHRGRVMVIDRRITSVLVDDIKANVLMKENPGLGYIQALNVIRAERMMRHKRR